MKPFELEGPVFNFLSKVLDFFVLNIIYIICCIPVITIGAATTALYYASIKQVHQEGYVTKNFFQSFRANFKQATLVWIPALLVFAVLSFNSLILPYHITNSILSGAYILNMALLIAMVFFFNLVFPLLSRFDNTTRNTLRNAIVITLRSFPWALLSCVIWHFPIIALCISPFLGRYVLMFWIFSGFSFSAYLAAAIYETHIFIHYIPKK